MKNKNILKKVFNILKLYLIFLTIDFFRFY